LFFGKTDSILKILTIKILNDAEAQKRQEAVCSMQLNAQVKVQQSEVQSPCLPAGKRNPQSIDPFAEKLKLPAAEQRGIPA
jgi:hypothetical protein